MKARNWPRTAFNRITVINNAYRIRPDWDDHVFPFDFSSDALPALSAGQRRIEQDRFVPAQNLYGGFVLAGATMAFTTAYWALAEYSPRVLAFFGCDMYYPTQGSTHFYGTGRPDPLRPDISLRSLPAKSARLMQIAAAQGCACVNLSYGPSALVFQRVELDQLSSISAPEAHPKTTYLLRREASLGYETPSGRYWLELHRFDPNQIDTLDAAWLETAATSHRHKSTIAV